MGWNGSFNLSRSFVVAGILAFLLSCGNENTTQQNDSMANTSDVPAKPKIPAPQLSSDSAFAYVKKQVEFGPRVPGTPAHDACGKWFESTLERFGLKVTNQRASVHTFDQKSFRLFNVIGSYKPEHSKRILLLAHWDCRPFADAEKDPAKRNKPIDGADDGASGAGLLLEIARQLSIHKPDIGVDFLFTDLEDYGQPDDSPLPKMENSWCLGTQYWCRSPHVPGYRAQFGILLDMVGAKGALFPKEGTGMYYAPDVQEKVWNVAKEAGFGQYFVNTEMHNTTDDHLYVNQLLQIPCIDIVHMRPDTRSYGAYHHTQDDNLDIIDPTVLRAVGQTVLEVLYREL